MPQATRTILGYRDDGSAVYADAPVTQSPSMFQPMLDTAGVALGGAIGASVRGIARINPDTAVNALPAVGGMIGGIVGSPTGAGAIGTAALGGMAGEALRQEINGLRGKGSTSLADLAKGVAYEGAVQGGAQAVGGLAGAGLTHLGQGFMQSALKPGIRSTLSAIKHSKAPPVVQTLLDEGINVSKGGIVKLNALISATNTAVKDAIAGLSSAPVISPIRVASRLTPVAKQFGNQVAPQADLAAVSAVGEDFLAAHGAQDLTIKGAQELKTGTYRALGKRAYGEVKGATTESEKALARGLKEEIEAEASKSGIDLSSINLREGRAIDALDRLAHRVGVAGNNNPLGLAGLAVSHPVTFLTMLIDRSSLVKSLIARGMYSSAGSAAHISPQLIRAAVVAIASSPDEAGQMPSAPEPSVAPVPVVAQTVTRKDLVRMATALNTTVAEQERRAIAGGFRVIR